MVAVFQLGAECKNSCTNLQAHIKEAHVVKINPDLSTVASVTLGR